MYSSVIMARTRMWRIAVAITRGGYLCGDWWQRLQLARNRFSPSTRSAASMLLGVGLAFAAAGAEPSESAASAAVSWLGEDATTFGSCLRSCAAAKKQEPKHSAQSVARIKRLFISDHH